ncbi:hypothetical protein B5P45_19055 [Phyllobacterium zundukense]|uniref:Uncharacterized protein n=1 Tax=Phyllobacterium zundukense TaxID=1867719 RepID=A0A2N9VUM1_9HYPH|nr:hypothetical protein BLM14_27025 [Phyllobacterium zundukense]PIO43189.1 hypothetical protein B5P45_19055 [Phyllobacterium zundukense]
MFLAGCLSDFFRRIIVHGGNGEADNQVRPYRPGVCRQEASRDDRDIRQRAKERSRCETTAVPLENASA